MDTLKLLFLNFKLFIQPYSGTDFTSELVNKRTWNPELFVIWPPFCQWLHIKRKGSQMTNNSEFHVLLLIKSDVKFVPEYGWMKDLKFKNSSFNVSSVVFMYAKPWPHCGITSFCRWSLHAFTSRYDSTLLDRALFYTEEVFV